MSEANNSISELSKKVEFLLDIINLLEVNDLLPPKLIERSRNRMRIKQIREKLEKSKSEELEKDLKRCLEKELDYERFFKKLNKPKILTGFLKRFCG